MVSMRIVGILLVLVLAFGGLIHALVPHNHTEGAIDLFHTALHVEQKHLLDIDATALVLAVILAVPALFLARTIALNTATISAALNLSLRRGVLAYRRFG